MPIVAKNSEIMPVRFTLNLVKTSQYLCNKQVYGKKKNMGFRVSYAHALTPVERGLGLFQ